MVNSFVTISNCAHSTVLLHVTNYCIEYSFVTKFSKLFYRVQICYIYTIIAQCIVLLHFPNYCPQQFRYIFKIIAQSCCFIFSKLFFGIQFYCIKNGYSGTFNFIMFSQIFLKIILLERRNAVICCMPCMPHLTQDSPPQHLGSTNVAAVFPCS